MAASARPRDLPFQEDLPNYFGKSWWVNGRSDYLLVDWFPPDTRGIWICLVCGFLLHVPPNTCNKKCGSTIIFWGLCKYRDKLNMWLVSWGFPREVPSRSPWSTDYSSDEYRRTIVNNNFWCHEDITKSITAKFLWPITLKDVLTPRECNPLKKIFTF